MSETPLSFNEHSDEAIKLANQPVPELNEIPDNITSLAARASLNLDRSLGQSEDANAEHHATGTRILAGVVTAASLASVGGLAYEAIKPPTFDEKTKVVIAQPNDTLTTIASQITGVEKVDIRDVIGFLKSSPANSAVLQDGLHSGDAIVVPISVKK